MNHTKKPSPKKPFFTRFLENQHLEEVVGGRPPPNETHKFPSDSDEEITSNN